MTNQNTHDNLNRLTGTSSALSFSYQYNAASQRTRVTQFIDGSYWLYGYDALGQLTSAVKYFWDGTPYAGQQYGFTFDTIGNRLVSLAGGDSNKMNLRTNIYADNLLNQLTNRTVPGFVDVMGLTLSTNTVKVNGTNAYQKWEYFREQMGTNNNSAPQWVGINVTSSATNEAPVSGGVYLAQTPESFTYDLDGNQTSDGRFTYAWDAENRLISAISLTNAPVASMYSNVFTYDYLWRRIQKVVWTNSGSSWVLSYTNKFVYDGWNVAAILDGTNNLLYSFTWGTDLSGTVQGAGGVGGLVSITYCAPNAGTNAGTYFPCYDGNGNVVALVNAANGSIAANWEYGPFGELIRATGPMAKLTPFMFSTKFYDWETGLYYYGHRYYNPSTGRWLSRDPMEELGGLNLYGYVDNDPSDYVDTDGENRISSPNPHPSPLPGGSRGGPGNQWGGGYNPGRPTAPESESVVAAWISGFWDGIKQAVTTPSYIKCEASCSFDAGLNSFNPTPWEIHPGVLVYNYGDNFFGTVDGLGPTTLKGGHDATDLMERYYTSEFEKRGGQAEVDRLQELLNRQCSKLGKRAKQAMEQKLSDAVNTQGTALKAAKLAAVLQIAEATKGFYDCYEKHCKQCLEQCSPE